MQTPTPKRETWWFFFPVVNLDITDETHDLERPMFGDATFISKRHIPLVMAWLYSKPEDRDGLQPWLHTTELEKAAGSQPFHSFLMVRRSGIVELLAPDDTTLNSMTEDAAARAHQVASFFQFVFFAQNWHPWTFFLVTQVAKVEQKTWIVASGGGGIVSSAFGHSPLQASDDSALHVSRDELLVRANQEPFQALGRVLVQTNPGLSQTLYSSIVQAATRLSDAIHAPKDSSQLLNAVTALEILLSASEGNDPQGYKVLERRLAALVGTDAVKRYNLDAILRARHLYVHRGEELTVSLIPMRAIGLVLASLCRYAELAFAVKNKRELLSYLDFIYAADDLLESWNDEERQAYERLLKHQREGVYFDWQERTLDLDYPPYRHRNKL